MIKKLYWAGLLGMTATALVTGAELKKGEFDPFQEQCQLSLNEPWRTIPWNISLLDAQQKAAQEQKPIYIWAMDGHPLGCT